MSAGQKVRFDIYVWQGVPWLLMQEDARYLETLDVGTLWVGDKYEMLAEWGGDPVLEAWSTLGALAICTTHVRLGTLVSDALLRHPAMLAKQAATVDCISGGASILGWVPEMLKVNRRLGLASPALAPARRVDRLREAVEVIDALLRDHHVSYQGNYYQLNEAPLSPVPLQRPRPPSSSPRRASERSNW